MDAKATGGLIPAPKREELEPGGTDGTAPRDGQGREPLGDGPGPAR